MSIYGDLMNLNKALTVSQSEPKETAQAGAVSPVPKTPIQPQPKKKHKKAVTTGLEVAMRRRKKRNLWNLAIDEFAGYVANEGSVKTLAHVFSEGRKFKMTMTVAHQDLSQLTPRMIGALSNVQTKVIFGIGRSDAEFFAKGIGRVDTEAIKRHALTETQHELFEPLANQWELWTYRLRFQGPRHKPSAALLSQRFCC